MWKPQRQGAVVAAVAAAAIGCGLAAAIFANKRARAPPSRPAPGASPIKRKSSWNTLRVGVALTASGPAVGVAARRAKNHAATLTLHGDPRAVAREAVVLVMVGLPARGKSYLSGSITRHLSLLGVRIKVRTRGRDGGACGLAYL